MTFIHPASVEEARNEFLELMQLKNFNKTKSSKMSKHDLTMSPVTHKESSPARRTSRGSLPPFRADPGSPSKLSKNFNSSRQGGISGDQNSFGAQKSKFRTKTLQPIDREKYSRDIYNHKFTIKEDAFKVLIDEKTDSPRYIDNKKDFNEAIKQYIMKDQIVAIDSKAKPTYIRNTRMGGHLTNTLSRAGLNNIGIISPVPV